MGVVVVAVECTCYAPLNDDGSTYIVRRILEWISSSRNGRIQRSFSRVANAYRSNCERWRAIIGILDKCL